MATDYVDKEELIKCISLQSEVEDIQFTESSKLYVDENLAFGFKLMGNIQIPVSLQDIIILKQMSEKAQNGMGCNILIDPSVKQPCQIYSQKVLATFLEKFDMKLITHNLQLNINLEDFEVKLDKFMLYETGSHFKRTFASSQIGTIGTVILQLPVDGGHKGGQLVVEYKGKRKIIDTNQGSDKSFYLSSFYNCCNHFMEPVTEGFKLTLVFNLVWRNLKAEKPYDFPVFLSALNGIQKVLNSWNPVTFPQELVVDQKISAGVNEIKELLKPSTKPWISQRDTVERKLVNDSLHIGARKTRMYPKDMNSHLSLYSEKTLMNHVLFFVLENQYGEQDVPLHRLRGNDLILAQLFLNCSFIDVHIATVIQRRFQLLNKLKSEDWRQNVAEKNPLIRISSWKDSENVSRHYDIKLNPEHQCVGPIRNLLALDKPDKVEVVSFGGDKCKIEIEEQYFFRRVLVIWPKEESFRISCSFELNSVLDRMENSLNFAILKMKDDVHRSVTQDLKKLISFGSIEPQILRARSGLEKGEITLRLLRLCIRLEAREEGLALLKLLGSDFAEEFQKAIGNDTENFEGIQNEKVSQAIAEFQCLVDWSDIAELIKRMISPHRITQQFIPTLSLAKYLMEFNCVERAKEVGNFITSSFANIDQHLDTCFSCYIRLGNAEWLQSLISDISKVPLIAEANLSKKYLLGTFISSPVIWELVTSSDLAESTMNMLVTHQLTLLLNELSESTSKVTRQKTLLNESFFTELSSCLKCVGRLERESYLVDSKCMSMVHPLLKKLGIQQLLDLLVIYLIPDEQQHFDNILRLICKLLDSLMKTENITDMLRRESILDAIKRLNQSEDKLLLRSFLEQVGSYEMRGSWDCKIKYELFDTLFDSSGIWNGLDSTCKLIVLDSCTTTVSCWIADIFRLLDSSRPVREEVLSSQALECVKLFFLTERNRLSAMTDNCNVLQHVLSKLSPSQLMKLVLDLYVFNVNSKLQANIKRFPTCLVLYRELCLLIFSRDFVSVVKKDQVANVILCLLWLEDDQLWELFSNNVSTLVKKSCMLNFMSCILQSVEIQQGLVESPSAFTAYVRIVEGWVEKSKSWKEPKFTWRQPNAVVNGHSDLQAFLRSPRESMLYQNFTSVVEARRFVDNLLEELKHHEGIEGFSINAVTRTGGKSAYCSIAKNLSYHVTSHQNVLKMYQSFKEKFDQFLQLWINLNDRLSGNIDIEHEQLLVEADSDDDVLILPPAKHIKLEIDVVDLST